MDAINIAHRGSLTIEAGANSRIIVNILPAPAPRPKKTRPRHRRKEIRHADPR